MKLSAQDEYGLRCLLQIARRGDEGSTTIPEISRAEGLTNEYVAKLLRILRRGGLIVSTRGQSGGYSLSRPASDITVSDVLEVLGGRLYEAGFCQRHSGSEDMCAHSTDCSIRTLWRAMQAALDQVLNQTTLKNLLRNEEEMISIVSNLVHVEEAQLEYDV